MKRVLLALLASGVVAGCGAESAAPPATPSSTDAATPSAAASADPLAVAVPGPGRVHRGFAPDGWPVFVVGLRDGTVDVFGAIAYTGPDRLGDEVGWCHYNNMFEATSRGRRYDITGRSATGIGGLVRYAASVADGAVHIGARGEPVTGKAATVPPVPCTPRALLRPDYPAPVTLTAVRSATAKPVRVTGVLTSGEAGDGTKDLVPPDAEKSTLRVKVAQSLTGEPGKLARTFWVVTRDGKVEDIAISSVPPPDQDVSESYQFGYLVRVEGDWIYFDRAEVLLGEAAVAAAKEDGKPAPEEGMHYYRNRNTRLRRYRVERATRVLLGEAAEEDGVSALPRIRRAAGKEFSVDLTTRNGKLLMISSGGCGG